MSSKFWLKGCKFSAVVGTTLGLLMPGLPLLAVAPSSNIVEDASFAQSGELLIAQSGCSRATMREQFRTDTYNVFICEDGDGDYFYQGINRSNGDLINVYGVTFTDSGYYMVTTYDDYGNEYTYMVGDALMVYENGEQIWYEPTY
ncbi:hypothetical protein [Oscillatoria acuminata]|uniref:Uncharacterized protein n=1 Tax=Oscillatoria acuminata PCC 6304 TaxID=56110 RepID=K9TGI9_9CYAN|nr:hypothetical protein [Oscillatoria acuminata]AFY81660.1 hypothetical protein Oscil6304_1991 [Oscillatoria acuminata PCC 6304]